MSDYKNLEVMERSKLIALMNAYRHILREGVSNGNPFAGMMCYECCHLSAIDIDDGTKPRFCPFCGHSEEENWIAHNRTSAEIAQFVRKLEDSE